jgi:N6-L-threonylcarbamoyladenine synthase
LLVSGGHTQILIVNDVGKYERLGTTIDDAVGEAYDKVAKLLNLGYPGGPIVEDYAKKGDSKKIKFPRPLIHSGDLNFSFSGLKTAVRREIEKSIPLTKKEAENICSSFQDKTIFNSIDTFSTRLGITLHVAPQDLCTDNGAMVAWAGAERFSKNYIDNLSIEVRPRWPLDPDAKTAIGAGVKA